MLLTQDWEENNFLTPAYFNSPYSAYKYMHESAPVFWSKKVKAWVVSPFLEVEEGLRDPKDNPCWKGYKPVGTKKKGGRTVPNCVPKESVQKSGPAGQLKANGKVDVKGTVLGSPEKSQKGLRGKLVGGGT